MEIEILDARSNKSLEKFANLDSTTSIADVKQLYEQRRRKYYPDRQSFRLEARGKSLKDSDTLGSMNLRNGGALYFKDLGPQIGWATVFLCEYTGPLLAYMLFYCRPAIIYGAEAASQPRHLAVQIAAGAWCFHYVKRNLETIFVHRFSHNTMPIGNLFKNCSYYWGFAAIISYFMNHPRYTPPIYGDQQMYAGLASFLIMELGNLSIHLAFKNLRPPGTKERRIPVPTSNPFTLLFNQVSCPNYTYEIFAWVSYAFMSQSSMALLFAIVGGYQMTVWALGKHRNYRREFRDYPKNRKAIFPFLL